MENIHEHKMSIQKMDREKIKGHGSLTIWLYGLSGSGKSTLASLLENRLNKEGIHTFILDGDNTRMGLNSNLGFSSEDRTENIRRVSHVCKLMNDAGLIVISSLISPLNEHRELARDIIGDNDFIEVLVDVSIDTCKSRDPKGLYEKAIRGEIKNFTGISDPFEVGNKSIKLKNENLEHLDKNVDTLIEIIKKKIK